MLSQDATAEDEEPVKCMPGLCAPSKWQPQQAPHDVKMSLCKFRRGIEQAFDVLKTRQCDLKWSQQHCLSELQQQKDLTVFPANKNLGPSVSNRTNCIMQVLSEHLKNVDDCECIDPTTAAAASAK